MSANLNEPFRDKALVISLIDQIKKEAHATKTYKIMEVCGTHTMSISRNGLRSVLPHNVKLVSGPGCPVCVTSQGEIDAIFQLLDKNCAISTFGDMLKIPTSQGSTLASARACGADVNVIYSPLDTIKLAQKNPDREYVFIGIGFETTIPTSAFLIMQARAAGLKNLSVISLGKTMPPAIDFLLSDKTLEIDGFLCPGHVTTVTGGSLYEPIVKSKKAAVVAGFEPVEMLDAILEVIRQVNADDFKVTNKYSRVVDMAGNPKARDIMNAVLEPCDASWRGLGVLKNSGLKIRKEFEEFDALKKFDVKIENISEIKGCKCGLVLTGKILPSECGLFKKRCSPENPIGPCMVSSEGTCAAYYKYES